MLLEYLSDYKMKYSKQMCVLFANNYRATLKTLDKI